MDLTVDLNQWTPVPIVKADRYQDCAVSSAMARHMGGKWALRSGVLRNFSRDKDGRMVRVEYQLDEGSWMAVQDADAGLQSLPDTVYVKPGLKGGLPVDALQGVD